MLIYNIGANTFKQCRNTDSQFYILNPTDQSCTKLTSNINKLNLWEELKNNSSEVNRTGVRIQFNEGEPCSSGINYKLTLDLECDENLKPGELQFQNLDKLDRNACENTLLAKSKSSCKKINYYILYAFISNYYFIFGFIMIVIGFFQLFFAKRYLPITGFILAYLILFSITAFVLALFLKGEDFLFIWAAVGGCLIPTTFYGWLMHKYEIAFYLSLGGCFGFVLAFFSYYTLLYRIFTTSYVYNLDKIRLSIGL